jgi:tRNA modification GTPase
VSATLIKVLAGIEAYIDFPDEEIKFDQNVHKIALEVARDLQKLIDTNFYKNSIENGVNAALVGRPNVGKSSLMNALLNTDRAIVSEEPGTTRDFLVETVKLGQDTVKISDTAGLRAPESTAEKIGIAKTIEIASSCDLLILVIDATNPDIPSEIKSLLNKKPTILVLNKIDLCGNPRLENLPNIETVALSAETGHGLDLLKSSLGKVILEKKLMPSEDEFIVNSRHVQILSRTKSHVDLAIEKLREGIDLELAASDLRLGLELLGEITGRYSNESMLDELFSQFCLGK